jgi:hypothetical protein
MNDFSVLLWRVQVKFQWDGDAAHPSPDYHPWLMLDNLNS